MKAVLLISFGGFPNRLFFVGFFSFPMLLYYFIWESFAKHEIKTFLY